MVSENHSYYTEQTADALRRVARSVSVKTGGAVDADELFSAGEYEVARAIARFDPSGPVPFVAWACQRARWAMQDYMRSIDPVSRAQRKSGVKGSGYVYIEAKPVGYVDAVADAIDPDRGEAADALGRAMVLLDQLPAEWRRVVRAHYIEGQAPAAIALQMGCSRQSVCDILKKAVERLRRLYERRSAAP